MILITEGDTAGRATNIGQTQLEQILTAIDLDLDLVVLVGGKCEAQVARAGTGYDRVGVTPFTAGAELRILKAGRVLLRMGGQDLLVRVIDTIIAQNCGDQRRRNILRRVWGLTEQTTPAQRAS